MGEVRTENRLTRFKCRIDSQDWHLNNPPVQSSLSAGGGRMNDGGEVKGESSR